MTVDLTVNGTRYRGWQSVEVTRSIEAIAGSFSLAVTERWPGSQARYAISPGAACTLAADGEALITGHVDTVDVRFDDRGHGVTIAGRDVTGDLVDCSAEAPGGELRDVTLTQLAARLAQPFGVEVRAETDAGRPFDRITIEPGESAFEAIERACRMRAVLPVSDGRGGLLLTTAGQAGRAATTLAQGQNILAAGGTYSWRDRYSTVTVKGQAAGTDSFFGEPAAAAKGRQADPAIGRHRPLTVIAEAPGDDAALAERAAWEVTVRRGRSRSVEITVAGWRMSDGRLWAPNMLVPAVSDWLGIDQDMLIVSVTYSLDETGTLARLSLMRPDAYALLATPEIAPTDPFGEPGW